ncbi:hypothetical protein ATCV1_z103L [Acanthocystis turfacea chlorella virus 1]|uniref:Uncharacterized protein z103L n=1 Tax=Chlorovirus heliozoae TaxID=322019 RepID=A7K863_9PHYC|nr:hypothetical protein ATCV1_z103L [Acanthocystis turfacea chlorella virus 1]ABT16237.1 hypothetical protein ATCV1_z103L [Acanthocystis turfacea chlorella virus 1]
MVALRPQGVSRSNRCLWQGVRGPVSSLRVRGACEESRQSARCLECDDHHADRDGHALRAQQGQREREEHAVQCRHHHGQQSLCRDCRIHFYGRNGGVCHWKHRPPELRQERCLRL